MGDAILLSKEFILVIDTNSPSCDFFSSLCAYCTGFDQESATDHSMVDKFYEEMDIEEGVSVSNNYSKNPFYDFVIDKINHEGDYSPCSIWLNKRYGCNEKGEYSLLSEENYNNYSFPAPMSVGIFFDQEPEAENIDLIKKRARQFFQNFWSKSVVEVEGIRLIVHTKYGEEIVI